MNDYHNETSAVLSAIASSGKVEPKDLGDVAHAAFRDGVNNAIASICEDLSPENVTNGIRYAMEKIPDVAAALRGKHHEDILVVYRETLGALRALVERHRMPKGGA